MKQALITVHELADLVPEGGTVPDSLEVQGVVITGDQWAKIVNTIRPVFTVRIQRIPRTTRIAYKTEGTGMTWYLMDAEGNVEIPGLHDYIASRKDEN